MAEKNQPPTPKRLQDARRRGDVVFSADVAAACVFVAGVGALWLAGPLMFQMLADLWNHATSARLLTRPDERVPELLAHTAHVLLWGTVAVSAVAALAGIAGSFFQVGGLMAWERIKPDMNRLHPGQGFKRIFSTRNLANLAKMVLKTLLLAGLVYVVLRASVDTAIRLGHTSPAAIMDVGARVVLVTFGWAAVVFAAMSAVDYANQHYQHLKSLRMSIDEVRREYRDMQGDPTHRSRRRSTHFEAVYFSLADRVRNASAVIHAPGVAVALQYLGPHDLPRVVARGEGELAAQIRQLAGAALIPMKADAQLAARLHEEVPLDRQIPRSMYPAVAKLLRWAEGSG